MNSLKQYIDLFNANRATIEANSAPVLNRHRPAALDALAEATLPERGDEGYESTSINEMFAPDYGVNLARVNIPVDVAATFRCDVPNMSTLLGVVVNDGFVPSQSLQRLIPEGVIFDSLKKVSMEHPELVERYYGTVAPADDPSVALNTLLVEDGVMVYIPKNVALAKPLQLVNIFKAPIDLMAVRRMLIVVEEGASASILVCDHTQDAEHAYLSEVVTEIIVAENARLDFYEIEESTATTSRRSQMFVRQHEGSNVLINGMTLWNGTTRNDYHIDIVGSGCETMLAGMAIGSRKQHIDNDSQVNHNAPHSHSTQLFKYVLGDESRGSFEGGILVSPSAPYTEAYQSNRNILASTEAKIHTKPQLEIYNDEVKCSHGTTTGQLDADALFYMRTRGIPEAEARTMLMQAFMADVIDTVRMESLRDRLRHLVERRFESPDGACGECSSACHKQ